jgi:protein-disulfide isomerase
MKKRVALSALIILILFCVQPAFSQSNDELKTLRQEMEALKEGQKSIQKDLQEIKNLLRAKSADQPVAPQEIVLTVNNEDHVKGDKKARVVMVEYSDYQ